MKLLSGSIKEQLEVSVTTPTNKIAFLANIFMGLLLSFLSKSFLFMSHLSGKAFVNLRSEALLATNRQKLHFLTRTVGQK
nr:hypothetical protein BHI3_31540 [Bacteriovorax sp. HI3]